MASPATEMAGCMMTGACPPALTTDLPPTLMIGRVGAPVDPSPCY